MATLVIPNSFAPGEVIEAAEMNENFTNVKNFAESLSTGAGFDAGAINSEDIAGFAIIEGKIATGAVTNGKIQNSVTLTTPILGVAAATSIAVGLNVVYHIGRNPTVGAYTLQITDDGIIVEMLNSSGTTLTIPLFATVAFPVGTQITILQTDTGQTTIAGVVGVTVNGTPGLKLRTQWSSATLVKRATNTWVALGDLAA